jgi:predicted permease
MRKLRALLLRLRGLLGRGRADEEFSAELEAHLALHIEEGKRAGLSEAEARRRALISLGGAEQARQAYRDRSGLPWLEDLLHDLRYAWRMVLRNPGFAAVAVFTLATGIGACATAFTWIDAVMLQPLSGVRDPGRLAAIESVTPNGEWVPNSYPDFIDFRDHLKQFDGIAVSHPSAFSVGREDHGERVWGELVSGNFFSVLGVQAETGRLFLPSEYGDAPGAYPVAVISDRYWRAHYGADPAIAGRTIRINQHELTIVGVAAPAFHGSMPVAAFDVWVPYMEQSALNGVKLWMLRDRHDRNMLGIGRLKQGVTFEQANAELKALAERMAVANADVSLGMSAILLPLSKSPHGPQGLLAGPLRVLMGVSVLLLLIVCANVANLLLARATVREKEFTARMALGARRGRIARQVLTESLMLTAAGAGLGLAVTPWLAYSLKLLMPPGPQQAVLTIDTRPNFAVLAFTAGVCVLTTLAAGLIPALQAGRINLSARLNANGRGGTAGRGRNRLRSVLVSAEVALALVAMVGAGLLGRGFQQTMRIDPGFNPDHVLLNQFYLSTNGYNLVQRKEFCRRLEERMVSAPGVTGIAYSDGVPLGFEPSWWEELDIEGYARQPNENMNIFRNVVSAGYLPLMHIPIVEGRNFTDQDNENAPAVMIVNEAFVRRFFAGRDPIGHRIHGWGTWFRVVGVAKDSKYHYLAETTPAYFYVPFRQVFREDMNLAFYVRTRGAPDYVLSTLREQVRAIDPNVTVYDAAPLKEFIGASLYPQKVAATLMTVLGSLSLLLAAIGLYSVMAYSVAQRTQEIGVRMALGAQPGHVLGMVVRQGLALTAAGLACGVLVALGLMRLISLVSFTNSGMGVNVHLLGGHADDVLIYAAALVVLSAVAVLASYLPARRAAHTNPMQALRMD